MEQRRDRIVLRAAVLYDQPGDAEQVADVGLSVGAVVLEGMKTRRIGERVGEAISVAAGPGPLDPGFDGQRPKIWVASSSPVTSV